MSSRRFPRRGRRPPSGRLKLQLLAPRQKYLLRLLQKQLLAPRQKHLLRLLLQQK
uniref:Uncharacterized protein n=1 Tax=Arundo donax TaxID=35708 RepID=A0A0A9H6G3_ARUDO